MPTWAIQILVSIALSLLAYMFNPRPKIPSPDTSQGLDAPKANAGAPVYVVQGTEWIEDPNCLGYWDVSTVIQKVKM